MTDLKAGTTRFGMGARVRYYGSVCTVIRHGNDKYGEYTLISLSGMRARVCPASLVPIDAPREVISERAVANFLTNSAGAR